MTEQLITMAGAAVTIIGANWLMLQSFRNEIRIDIKDVHGEIKEVRGEIKDVRDEMHAGFSAVDEKFAGVRADMGKLSERMARVEGMIDGLREAIAARAVA